MNQQNTAITEKFPFPLQTTENVEGRPMAGFVHRDIVIHDPTVTECGRFPVKPDFYNMNDTQVIAMLRLNAGIEAAAEAALHAGAKAIQRHLELSIEEPSKELFNTENRTLTERIVLRYALDEIARRQGA